MLVVGVAAVIDVDNHTGREVMRDLTVADIHTYYVIAGDTPVLVHNNNYPCGRVAYGSTDASKAAIQTRQMVGVGSGQNVAIYSIELPNGKVANVPFVNQVRGAHSEANADDFLAELGFNTNDVKAIYSERNFCTTVGHECAGRVGKFTSAALSWSFEKGDNAMSAIRRAVYG